MNPQRIYITQLGVFCKFKIFLLLLFLSLGCNTVDVEKAFNGEFSRAKNNKLINNYCLNCHVHKDFNAQDHIIEKRKSYKKSFYRKTSDCKTCHYVEKIWSRNDLKRKTRYPALVGKGQFLEYEHKEKKKQKK